MSDNSHSSSSEDSDQDDDDQLDILYGGSDGEATNLQLRPIYHTSIMPGTFSVSPIIFDEQKKNAVTDPENDLNNLLRFKSIGELFHFLFKLWFTGWCRGKNIAVRSIIVGLFFWGLR